MAETHMWEWPYCRGHILVLNTVRRLCKEIFHIGQREITVPEMAFCLHHTIGTAKCIDGREQCIHLFILLAHVPQQISGGQRLSGSPHFRPKCNS